MKIRIQCRLGDANCVLDDVSARAVFEKLTGKTSDPLPETLKARMPETFHELQELWGHGKRCYLPVNFATKEMVREFDPGTQEDLVFIAPITGG